MQDLADSDESGHRKLVEYTLRVIPSDQKGILSRRAQGEKVYREHQSWVSNSISLSLVSLRKLSVRKIQMVSTCAFHRRKEMKSGGGRIRLSRGAEAHLLSHTAGGRLSSSCV